MNRLRRKILLLASLCSIAATSSWAAPARAQPDRAAEAARTAASPAELYDALFRAVQQVRLFPDSKTFADMIPRAQPATIMARYRSENPQGRAALGAFVARNFRAAGAAASPGPGMAGPTEHETDESTEPDARPSMRAHITGLWPMLAKPPMAVPPGSSAIQLPDAYVVAGGRYQEMYYWDSYFTMLGLKADGEAPLIDAMLTNFVSLVDRYGHVPNGTRTYYLSRSQPPFLALMMDLAASPAVPAPVARDRRFLAALRAEHAYWMKGAACLDAQGQCQHVVRMPDGSLLNRYWDARDTPRDESWAEDVATSAAAAPRPVNRDLRAGAESGWDYSSRWLRDGATLSTIHTLDIVPIDLNSLMWNLERSIARRCAALADKRCAAAFDRRAAARKQAMTRYLWSAADQRFADWDRAAGRATPVISAAILAPLFVGLATPAQAEATARLTEARLIAPGGLRTTLTRTGQQWDAPNGWAPLLWIAVHGLDRYGKSALADTLAQRWITTVSRFYACTGRMVEKYDVESGQAGGGGEYPVQDGFGWTNGVTRRLLDRPGMARFVVSACPKPG